MDNECDDKNEVVLDAKNIVELDVQGCEIISHTILHPNLTKISNDELKKELCESKRTLEQILGHDVDAVTYPYGACNSLVCKAAADAGYRTGFSVEPRTICQSANSLCIGRFKVLPNESMLRFKLKAHGAYRAAGFLRRLKRTLTGHKGQL
jgi:peptidoglycan/xylan/chitin deacetylase (PgdA/CDA1 family)